MFKGDDFAIVENRRSGLRLHFQLHRSLACVGYRVVCAVVTSSPHDRFSWVGFS